MNQDAAELKFGRLLSSPPEGDEVVISGISGCFPDSSSVAHFRDNLFNKVDLVVDDTRRWKLDHPEIPKRHGKIFDIEKYDASYFGIQYDEANNMDPLIRIFMEKAVEAVIDAGINPKDLEGSSTGVFVGACYSDTESNRFRNLGTKLCDMRGSTRSMIPNRVSYHLKLKGPSIVADTACSSSLFALEHAYRAIRTGQIENALVGGVNLCIHPLVSLQFARLGVLSLDGSCKAFDDAGNGYARSEAFGVLFLQKSKYANRVYCQVLHAKTNCDGFKDQGITYPSGDAQRALLRDFYNECQVDPTQLSFLEAHGTGTKVGDPEELNAIADIFCTDPNKSILIGSVKSNIGHTEPSSGVCSIIKGIIGMETGYIPPNLHYSKPRQGVKALEDGRLEVVVDKMPFRDNRGLIGINSFGFGGGNAHVLLKWNEKTKVNGGHPQDDVPRLVCISGRVEDSVNNILDDVKQTFDAEHIKLLHKLFRNKHDCNFSRGYSIVCKSGEICRSIETSFAQQAPLHLVFGDYDKHWQTIGRNLYTLPIFADSIQKIHSLLVSRQVNLKEVLFDDKLEDMNLNYLGHIAVQLAIVDLLKAVKFVPNKIFAYSIGEIACGYFDEVLKLEEAVQYAYSILDMKINKRTDSQYFVVLSKSEIIKILPKDIDVYGLTDRYSIIRSYDHNKIKNFVEKLVKEEIEVKNLIGGNQSKIECSSSIKSNLIKKLSGLKSRKWSEKRIISDNSSRNASPEYFVESLTASTDTIGSYFEKTDGDPFILQINSDEFTPVFETQSHALVNLSKSKNDLFITFLECLGRLYIHGYELSLDHIYPEVSLPVSRGTPMISSSLRWNHDIDWNVIYYDSQLSDIGESTFSLSTEDADWAYLSGHVIDGRNLFPATGYLLLVWDSITTMAGLLLTSLTVVFENCRFIRATTIPKRDKLVLVTMIQKETGNFEVIEGDSAVCTGRVYLKNEADEEVSWVKLSKEFHDEDTIKLKTKDIYKELRLRGYHYKGAFKKVAQCSLDATEGLVEWSDNFVSFMDNMLQLKILQYDSRLLYVPTSIDKLIIKSKKHVEYTSSFEEKKPLLPVMVSKEMDMISCGTIEIHGLKASSIAKRKDMSEPVYSHYQFVPNVTKLSVAESLRVNMQLILENTNSLKVKTIELDNLTETNEVDETILSPVIFNVLADMPLIQPDLTLLSSREDLDLPNITVKNESSIAKAEYLLLVTRDLLTNKKNLQQAFSNILDNGYVLTREPIDCDLTQLEQLKFNAISLNVLTVHNVGDEVFILLSKQVASVANRAVVKVSSEDPNFAWLQPLKLALKNNENVVIYAQNESTNGILGLMNCIRREMDGSKLKCVFIMDENAPEFDVNNSFYNVQLQKNITINVLCNGVWGTYRHLLLGGYESVESEFVFVKNTVRGDLSSLKWLESPLTQIPKDDQRDLVNVSYSAINFRDVMLASGRINEDLATTERIFQDCAIGFEFSGIDSSGKRVMGLTSNSAICSTLDNNRDSTTWKVPDSWSLEEAATVPVVYGTVIYAFIFKAKIKKGDTILIHSGTGGVGLAAINIAFHYGCTVYTTVGTQEKRDFLKSYFPQITDDHIGYSHDLSFEKFIYKRTNGRGVDIVLNSLSEDKLLASVRCLAPGGHFLEIGKYDFANNNLLRLLLLNKDATFHGIVLERDYFQLECLGQDLYNCLEEHFANGAVKPLPTTIFGRDEVEKAFRFMTTGKHIGKVLIEVRKEKCDEDLKKFIAQPRYYSHPENVYIILGGLGGFGLELADWLIIRGCRKLVLTSRSGVKTGYQAYRIKIWKTYGVKVHISTANITTEEGCANLIEEAQKLGEINSIFNLAVVLKDAILQNQTVPNFQTSFEAKAIATKYLDKITRKACKNLKEFVVFSSVSCGLGNAGQSNYGMSNSVMERICEQRKKDGLPALAIEWGAIGQVGLVAEMNEEAIELNIGGTLQQSITSCMTALDIFLTQSKAAVVGSMVVAEKGSSGSADTPVQVVANILGIKDLKSVSLHASLAELGMDSMNAVEIKQTLEREFEIFLTPTDIRTMTFAKLFELQNREESAEKPMTALETFKTLIRSLVKEDEINLPEIHLQTVKDSPRKVLFVPGIESVARNLDPLVQKLNNCSVVGFQFGFCENHDSIPNLAKEMLPHISKHVDKNTPFCMVAYSFGVLIALEVAVLLEQLGHHGEIICIDGGPDLLKKLTSILTSSNDSDSLLQTGLICHMLSMYDYRHEIVDKIQIELLKCASIEERVNVTEKMVKELKEIDDPTIPYHILKQFTLQLYHRIKCVMNYAPNPIKLKSKLVLFKAHHQGIQDCSEDYLLSECSEQSVDVHTGTGDHTAILESEEVLKYMEELGSSDHVPSDKIKLFENTNKMNGAIMEEEKIM